MATQTTNYHLGKPDSTDLFSAFRQLFNDNMDIIDANMGGGGGGQTYTLSISDHTITLTGSGGSSSSVTVPDDDTTYSFSISGNVITITDSDSNTQTITLPDNDTTYTLGLSGSTLSLTDSDGNEQTVTLPSGGSTVSFTQVVSSGTKIGTITINGVSTDIYAPNVPTKTSDLTNDSGFITSADIPTNVSAFTNDAGYLDSSDVSAVALSGDYSDLSNTPTIPTKVSDLTNDSGFTAVSWTQTQTTGTKIAEIDIDGTTTDVYAPNSGGGGGHTIEDASGTALTQRSTLQFDGYLKATDDNVNSKTKVSDAPTEITWDDWQNLSVAQKQGTKWLITDVPSAEGSIEADLLTPLWTNPNPTSAFASQNIALSSSDYDYLLIVCRYRTDLNWQISQFCQKGSSALVSYTASQSLMYRQFFYSTDTSYSVSVGYIDSGTDNSRTVPIAVYGIKKKITVSFDALAESVSTLASKCMLSDGETSVEDAINQTYLGDLITITGIDISSTGLKYASKSISVPAKTGYTHIGFQFGNTSSYRFFPLYLRPNGEFFYWVYASTSGTTTCPVYPVYKKN